MWIYVHPSRWNTIKIGRNLKFKPSLPFLRILQNIKILSAYLRNNLYSLGTSMTLLISHMCYQLICNSNKFLLFPRSYAFEGKEPIQYLSAKQFKLLIKLTHLLKYDVINGNARAKSL
jgi:hypothetical protein